MKNHAAPHKKRRAAPRDPFKNRKHSTDKPPADKFMMVPLFLFPVPKRPSRDSKADCRGSHMFEKKLPDVYGQHLTAVHHVSKTREKGALTSPSPLWSQDQSTRANSAPISSPHPAGDICYCRLDSKGRNLVQPHRAWSVFSVIICFELPWTSARAERVLEPM